MKEKTVEREASGAILQSHVVVKLGGRHYEVGAVTMRTLLKASEYCGDLPIFNVDGSNPFQGVLSIARDCEAVAPFVASLIVGTRGEYNPLIRVYRRWKMRRLVDRINCDSTPEEVMDALLLLLPVTQPTFFLGIISFMGSVNMLERQRDLGQERATTAFGQ